MGVFDGNKDVPETLVGESVLGPHHPLLTSVSSRFDLNVDRIQRVWISRNNVYERLTVIGLARDVSTLSQLCQDIELDCVAGAVVIGRHCYCLASGRSTIQPRSRCLNISALCREAIAEKLERMEAVT